MNILKEKLVILAVVLGFTLALASLSSAAEPKASGLPGMMSWSAFDVGSRGYVQGAAISNALTKKYETKIRILPSGTMSRRL